MKNVMITGGTGFIGKNLSEDLHYNFNIFSPSHKELDLLNYEALFTYIKKNQIDIIIHAAIHVPQFNGIEKEFFNDMQMFLNLEKVSFEVEKVIYFGSGAEYDKRHHIRNVTEDSFGKYIPITEYGLAKYTMTKLTRTSKNIYNLRLFGIFGKYELWQIKFISNLCCKAVYGLPLSLRKDCWFNFLYIKDLSKIVEWFIENTPKYHDYNICHDHHYLLSDLAEIVRTESGKNLDINILSQEKNLDYTASNMRIRSEYSDLKITPIDLAISDLYRYYLCHQNMIDFNILKNTK